MARKPSDNIRDAARKLKVESQRNPRVLAPGTTGAFSDKTAHPKQTTNSSGLKIDHKESHHLMPVDAYTAFTEGMTPEQIAKVDTTMEGNAFYKGDNNLNRTDLWKRYHTGRSKGVYKGKGAHQVANQAAVDGPKAKAKWAQMSSDERFNNLDMFVDDMTKNRTIGYQANMEARWLLGKDNTPDNIYGGNFSQRILNPRNAENAASTAKKTKQQREFLSDLNASGGSVRFKGARALPLIGPAVGLWVAGEQVLAGDYAAAAGTVVDEVVSEAFLDSSSASSGTLTDAPANHQRVQQRLDNPTVADKVFQDPINELEHLGKQMIGGLKNTFGGISFGF